MVYSYPTGMESKTIKVPVSLKVRLLAIVIIGFAELMACSPLPPHEREEDTEQSDIPAGEEHQRVFQELKIRDSLLFGLGFNHCDTALVRTLTSTDFEFYHDQSGVTRSQDAFVQSISGLCKLDYKPTRELEPYSLSVHLLRNRGEVYGAIQSGKHHFYGQEGNKSKYLTSTARFIHLWIREEGEWKLKRVLSYDHRESERVTPGNTPSL